MKETESQHNATAPIEHWLAAYDRGHTHPGNRRLHQLCAPLFTLSLLGLLWCVPTPASISNGAPVLNWATLAVMAVVIYYFIMSSTLAVGMLPIIACAVLLISWLETSGAPLLRISSLGLLLASIGQHLGHRFEQSGASLLKDFHYAAIAPIWVLAAIYRRFGIPY